MPKSNISPEFQISSQTLFKQKGLITILSASLSTPPPNQITNISTDLCYNFIHLKNTKQHEQQNKPLFIPLYLLQTPNTHPDFSALVYGRSPWMSSLISLTGFSLKSVPFRLSFSALDQTILPRSVICYIQ